MNRLPTSPQRLLALSLCAITFGGCQAAYSLVKDQNLHADGGPYRNAIVDLLAHDQDVDLAPAVGLLPRALETYSKGLEGYRPKAVCERFQCRGAGVDLFFVSDKDGQICFDAVQRYDIYDDFSRSELDRVDQEMRSYKYAVEIVGDPEAPELKHRALLPTDHVFPLDQVSVVKVLQKRRDPLKTPDSTPLRYVIVRYQVCGAAPPIPSPSRYLSVVVQPVSTEEVGNLDHAPYLLLWSLTDAPKAAPAGD